MNVTLYNKEDFVYMMTLKILRCVDYPGLSVQFSSFQSLSHVRLFVTPWTACPSLSFINSWSLLKLMSIGSVIASNHLVFCQLLLLPSIFPSIRVFSNESALHIRQPRNTGVGCHVLPPGNLPNPWNMSSQSVLCIRWPKYWSFSFNIGPSNE